jgi:hypothetical protein
VTAVFLVIEQVGCGTLAVGATRAGLCGEPIAMTKGTFKPGGSLGLRGGEEDAVVGRFALFEASEPSRDRKTSGSGTAELIGDSPDRDILFGTGSLEADGIVSFRRGLCCACSGEFRMASAMTSMRGGVSGTDTVACMPTGDSKRPTRGRGGRSGVSFPLAAEGLSCKRPFSKPLLGGSLSGVFGLECSTS